MKRVLLVVGGAVVVLAGTAWGIGMALPVEHQATVAAMIPAPLDSVQAAITAVADHPAWRPSVEQIDDLVTEGGRTRWAEMSAYGVIPMELTESTRGRVVTTIVGEGLGFGGRWTYDLTGVEGGTRVSITEDGEVYSPFFRFMSRFVMGYHGTATTYLQDLGRRFGSEVEVEVVV